jgi:hypothetical protein
MITKISNVFLKVGQISQKYDMNLLKIIKQDCTEILVLKGVKNRHFGTKKIITTPGYPVPVLSVLDAFFFTYKDGMFSNWTTGLRHLRSEIIFDLEKV